MYNFIVSLLGLDQIIKPEPRPIEMPVTEEDEEDLRYIIFLYSNNSDEQI